MVDGFAATLDDAASSSSPVPDDDALPTVNTLVEELPLVALDSCAASDDVFSAELAAAELSAFWDEVSADEFPVEEFSVLACEDEASSVWTELLCCSAFEEGELELTSILELTALLCAELSMELLRLDAMLDTVDEA